jgi:hypothetical protein
MLEVGPFEILNAIVCDDARREDNGKAILIGVYTGSILASKFPTQMQLAVWIEHQVTRIGTYQFSLRVLLDDEIEVFEVTADAVLNELAPGVLAFSGFPLQLQRPGTLKVQLRIAQEDWVTLRTLSIMKGQSLTTPPAFD